MFDIDKMYLMFPTIKPVYNKVDEVFKYVLNELEGSNKSESVANFLKFLNDFNNNDLEIDIEGIKDYFDSLKTTDAKYEAYLDSRKLVTDLILDYQNKDHELIKKVFENLDIKVKSLKYENYDNTKSESEQTKGALQNRLIELYKSVLLNENVIGEVMTPVDFTHVKDDILHFVDKTSTTNLSTFNQLDDINTKYDFLAGKAGVGQQANALMDYVLGSLSNLSITNFNVPKSNNRLDLEYSQELSQDDLNYYAKELNLNSDQVNKLQSVKIGHSLSAILNAFVDIAKDPYITKGNWVTMTTNTGNLLLRKGVHPFYVNAFLAQPVIKEYVEFSASYEASENQGLSTADAFIKEKFGEKEYDKRNNSNVFNEDLKTLRSYEFLNKESSQMNVFATFLKYQSASKAIKTNIDASKFMVNGIGGSVNSLIIAKNAVDSILEAEKRYNELEDKSEFKDNIILGFKSKFTNPNGSESIFSKYYSNIILKPEQIVKANPKLFLAANNTIQDTFNEISHDSKNEILLNEDLSKDLDKTFYSYVMSGFDALYITKQERKDLTLKFPKEFELFKENNKGEYTIIDEITVNQGNTLEFIGLNNRKKSQAYEKLMVGSFLDLLNKDEEFANKLIKYSYLVSGFANNKTQFFSMIPSQWFNRNNINRYILDKSAEYTNDYVDSNDDNFINQYYLANLENKKLVKNISEKQILKGSFNFHGFVLDKPGKAGYFRVKSDPFDQNPDVYYKLIGYNVDNQGVYTRFISNINDELSEIKLLNVKDKRGNRIINYDTKGINLKPVTETSPNVAKNINKETLSNLHDSAIYKRDRFYRENVIIKKEDNVEILKENLTILENNIINNISSDYGVVQINTNPSKNKTKEFIDLIKPQIKAQTYKENKGKFANEMFHYGLMWSRKKESSKPVNIKSFEKANYYAYHELDQNGNELPSIKELKPIISEIENALKIDMSDYDSVIGNIYLNGEYVYPHKDTTESLFARNYPVIVYTIGNNAGLGIVDNNKGKMTFANEYDKQWLPEKDKLKGYTNELVTTNGSIYTFGLEGKGRFELTHSTPIKSKKNLKFPAIELPNGKNIENYTITLTFRRAQDLTENIPESPKFEGNIQIKTKPQQLSLFPELSQKEYNMLSEEEKVIIKKEEDVEVSEIINSEQSVISLTENFTRNSVEKDSDYLYLFTDNAKRSSGNNSLDYNSQYSLKYTKSEPLNYPTITQAVIRGLNNAFPITTMVNDKRTQWTDDKFEEYQNIIDDEIVTIQKNLSNYKGIKFAGQMQFGKGKISNMKESAPKIFEYMTKKLAEIGIDNTGNKPTSIKNKPTEVVTENESFNILNDILLLKYDEVVKLITLDEINDILKYEDKEAKSLEKAQKWLHSEFKFIFDGESEYIKNIIYHSSQEGLQNNFDNILDGDTQKDIDYASRYSGLIKKISDSILENIKPVEVVTDIKSEDWQNEDNDDTCVPF